MLKRKDNEIISSQVDLFMAENSYKENERAIKPINSSLTSLGEGNRIVNIKLDGGKYKERNQSALSLH